MEPVGGWEAAVPERVETPARFRIVAVEIERAKPVGPAAGPDSPPGPAVVDGP